MGAEVELAVKVAEGAAKLAPELSALGTEAAALLTGKAGSVAEIVEDLGRINASRWLQFDGCGYKLNIAQSASGSPMLKVLSSGGQDLGGAQFLLKDQRWAQSVGDAAGLPTRTVPFPQSLESGSWHTFAGDEYNLQVTQYSNKGPLVLVNDLTGKEAGRARLDLFTRRWSLDSAR